MFFVGIRDHTAKKFARKCKPTEIHAQKQPNRTKGKRQTN